MSKEEHKTSFIMTYSWAAAGMIQDVGCGNYVELSELQRAHDDAARLEGERAEQWRLRRDAEADRDTKAAVIAELRDQLGECKGEYDRAVNKVDALRDQLAEAHSLFADVLSIDVPRTAQSLERMRSILSVSAEPAAPQRKPATPNPCTSCDNCRGFITGHDSSEQKPYSICCENCGKKTRAHEHAELAEAWNEINPRTGATVSGEPANKESAQ